MKHISMHPTDLKLEVKKKNIMPPRKTLSLFDYDHSIVQHTNKQQINAFWSSIDLNLMLFYDKKMHIILPFV